MELKDKTENPACFNCPFAKSESCKVCDMANGNGAPIFVRATIYDQLIVEAERQRTPVWLVLQRILEKHFIRESKDAINK